MAAATGSLSSGTLSRCPCCITRLIWMPFSLTMITELQITAWTLATYPRARSTPRRDNGVATVRRWTPARIGIGEKHSTHHKVFVFRYHIWMCLEQSLNVRWVHRFRAVRTSDVSARLGDLYGEIAFEADAAGSVLARQQTIHIVCMIIFHIAQLTFL